jgi:hypothetical protein
LFYGNSRTKFPRRLNLFVRQLRAPWTRSRTIGSNAALVFPISTPTKGQTLKVPPAINFKTVNVLRVIAPFISFCRCSVESKTGTISRVTSAS